MKHVVRVRVRIPFTIRGGKQMIRRKLPVFRERETRAGSAGRGFFHRIDVRIWRDAREQELLGSCILLKNLAVVQRQMPMSADYLLEELMENAKLLKRVYGEILRRWRSGMGRRSFDVLPERVGTPAARDFAVILSELDDINPAELAAAMRSFEEVFSADRTTRAMRRAYRRSVLTTAAAAVSVFAILMDFVMVVVFLDMFSMLASLQA